MLTSGIPRREVCRVFECKYGTLRKRLDKWGYSHLKNPGLKGHFRPGSRVNASYYLGSDRTIQGYTLKLRLFRDGYKSKQCEMCGLVEWNGQPAPLELDHINGVNSDNRLENLRILCPNCHAQTPTHCGKKLRKNL